LHKTSVGAEMVLAKILKRAKQLTLLGEDLPASTALKYFLKHSVTKNDFNNNVLNYFALLDDADIYTALKNWQFHTDKVLSYLSSAIVNRKLFHVELVSKSDFALKLNHYKDLCKEKIQVDEEDLEYFIFDEKLNNQEHDLSAYPIQIGTKNNNIIDVLEASD